MTRNEFLSSCIYKPCSKENANKYPLGAEFLDFYLAPMFILEDNKESTAFGAINEEVASEFGLDAESIHAACIQNVYSSEIRFESLSTMFGGGEDDPPYVLNTKNKVGTDIFGASAILNRNLLQALYEAIGDFYILPSSIHEIIIVPESFIEEPNNVYSLKLMVLEANQTVVSDEDKLSDSVYKYNPKKKEVEIVC